MEEFHQISAFIDDQLELDEKIRFVEMVHDSKAFKEETLTFLNFEKKLRSPAVDRIPKVTVNFRHRLRARGWFKQLALYSCAMVTALLLFFIFYSPTPVPAKQTAHRFIIYQPDIRMAALIGNFSNWEGLIMESTGESGYWEITVDLPPGEYRYSFLLDGHRQIADPTTSLQEHDDFGSVNSIINIQAPAKI
jgi:hypothetical protein